MSKATLEYNLSDIDEEQDFKRAIMANKMASALWDITHNTKKQLSYSFDGKEIDKYDALDLVFEKIHEILDNNHLDTEELWQ